MYVLMYNIFMSTGQEGGNQEVRDPQTIKALKDAVRRTDPTFFGFIFNKHYKKLDDGKLPHEERSKRAFNLTLEDKIIKRAGIETVIDAARDPSWSEKYLSPHARDALDRFIQEQENLQRDAQK